MLILYFILSIKYVSIYLCNKNTLQVDEWNEKFSIKHQKTDIAAYPAAKVLYVPLILVVHTTFWLLGRGGGDLANISIRLYYDILDELRMLLH